jgi:RNA 2',3'-cyclic 3'-phosphodiesterase
MTSPEQLRLFVAVEIPEGVRQALGDLQRELRGRGLERLRWVRPEGIHITLKFLGENPAGRVPAIAAAIGAATEGVPPHSLHLGKLGCFGSKQSPRVLWVDAEGDAATLVRLQRQVEEALSPLGFAPEQRQFSPHITLARVQPDSAGKVARSLADAVAAVSAPAAEIPVRAVSLMRSELRREGAVYTRLEAAPLV